MRLAALFLLWTATAASAHETWLLPRIFTVSAGGKVELDLTSGMAFPTLDHPIKPDRTKRAILRVGGKTADLTTAAGDKALSLSVVAPAAGVGVAFVELHPKEIELAIGKVDEYFAEIHATQAVRDHWTSAPPPRKWVERYAKHAKTFVRIGGQADDSWKQPVGLALEVVPESDPTQLASGKPVSFRVLKGGKPFAGFAVGTILEGDEAGKFATTEADGRVTVTFAKPARAMVYGTDLRPPTKAGDPWTSDFATLTLDIGR